MEVFGVLLLVAGLAINLERRFSALQERVATLERENKQLYSKLTPKIKNEPDAEYFKEVELSRAKREKENAMNSRDEMLARSEEKHGRNNIPQK